MVPLKFLFYHESSCYHPQIESSLKFWKPTLVLLDQKERFCLSPDLSIQLNDAAQCHVAMHWWLTGHAVSLWFSFRFVAHMTDWTPGSKSCGNFASTRFCSSRSRFKWFQRGNNRWRNSRSACLRSPRFLNLAVFQVCIAMSPLMILKGLANILKCGIEILLVSVSLFTCFSSCFNTLFEKIVWRSYRQT